MGVVNGCLASGQGSNPTLTAQNPNSTSKLASFWCGTQTSGGHVQGQTVRGIDKGVWFIIILTTWCHLPIGAWQGVWFINAYWCHFLFTKSCVCIINSQNYQISYQNN